MEGQIEFIRETIFNEPVKFPNDAKPKHIEYKFNSEYFMKAFKLFIHDWPEFLAKNQQEEPISLSEDTYIPKSTSFLIILRYLLLVFDSCIKPTKAFFDVEPSNKLKVIKEWIELTDILFGKYRDVEYSIEPGDNDDHVLMYLRNNDQYVYKNSEMETKADFNEYLKGLEIIIQSILEPNQARDRPKDNNQESETDSDNNNSDDENSDNEDVQGEEDNAEDDKLKDVDQKGDDNEEDDNEEEEEDNEDDNEEEEDIQGDYENPEEEEIEEDQ